MKKLVVTVAIIMVYFSVDAQKLHCSIFGGISNYQGDLQEKRYTFNQSHPAFGIGLLYEITDNLFARANVTVGRLSGDDAKGTKNINRNLNFSSPITDWHLGLEYNFLNLYDNRMAPYIFGGISYFHFTPYTKDAGGKRIDLQPLGTEGQGFINGRDVYKLSQFSIPFGGGIKFAFSDNFRIGLEIGVRKTNTDYIDDVSTTFVDKDILLMKDHGQKAVDFAFRADDLDPGLLYPAGGTPRGNAKNKDWYYFSGITLAFRLGAGNKRGISCPKKAY